MAEGSPNTELHLAQDEDSCDEGSVVRATPASTNGEETLKVSNKLIRKARQRWKQGPRKVPRLSRPLPPRVSQRPPPRSPETSDSDSSTSSTKSEVEVQRGLNYNLPPLFTIQDIFDDIVKKAMDLGFGQVIADFDDVVLNVGTMCSGTEAPLLGIGMVRDGLRKMFGKDLKISHRFSAEIEPNKQAYIERNFAPRLLFRDLREMGHSRTDKATNAYGSLENIPGDIDILVAGFPCVDFSARNQHKKELKDMGESGDVLLAILQYAKKYRPAIIILENVEHASWPLIKAIWENDESSVKEQLKDNATPWLIWDGNDQGYANHQCLLDTKHFYLPQTRRRGYMFLVRKDLVVNTEQEVLDLWVENLEEFKRPASLSVEAFLFPDHDPVVQQARVELSKSKQVKRETDWTLCKARYQKYREEIKVGNGRPLTKWVEGGTAICPDHFWRGWFAAQVERIWDTMDIAYLRNARQGFDALYVMRIWEFSQNVDYDKDATPQGLISCITPTGQPFLTHLGRALLGKEALAIQGMPVQKLNLTKDTIKELLDLAGNAMSTTVVTCTIISALLAGREALKANVANRLSRVTEEAATSYSVEMESSQLQGEKPLTFANSQTIKPAPSVIRHMVGTHTISCRCEFASVKSATPLLVCKDCGHRSCEKCGIQPAHNYGSLPRPDRFPPATIQHSIEQSLPMKIQVAGLTEDDLESLIANTKGHIDMKAWRYVKSSAALIAKSEFRYHSIKRSHCWSAIFEAAQARLEMVMSEHDTYWLLYGKVRAEAIVNSVERRVLNYPIARMTVHGNDLLQGTWQLRLPGDNVFDLRIEGQGEKVPSWKSKLGLVEFAEEVVWPSLRIEYATTPNIPLAQDITGNFIHLPKCGTATSSLHKKLSPGNVAGELDSGESPDSSLYLFLDRERMEGPVKDRFVFGSDPRRLEYQELRNPVAQLGPEWRPGIEQVTIIPCHVQEQWVACNISLKPVEGSGGETYAEPRPRMINDVFSKTWQMVSCSGAFRNDCRISTEILLSLNVPSTVAEYFAGRDMWRLGGWETMSPQDEDEMLKNFAWLFTNVKKLEFFPPGYQILRPPPNDNICRDCVPKPAETRWRWTGRASGTITPYEDALQAGNYERALKARPRPFGVRYRLATRFVCRFEIGLNLKALSHRVCGKLGGMPRDSNAELFWKFDRNFDKSSIGKFKRFKIKSNAEDSAYDSEVHVNEDESTVVNWMDLFGIKPQLGEGLEAYKREQEIKKKDRAQARLSSEFPNNRYSLRAEQKRSLTWMLRQEADNVKPWRMQEVEEAILPTLGWRVEVRGTKQSRVWGGVLADTVGYGKTATTLALIHKQSWRTRQEARMLYKGFISLKATLLLCPPTLIGQWDSEVDKFLGKDLYNVLLIKNQIALGSVTIADFEAADIIIVNSELLKSVAYWSKVALFAALPEGPTPGGRPFDIWHRRARDEIKRHIEDLKTRTTQDALATFVTDLDQDFQDACHDEGLAYDIPQRRLRGSKYLSWQQLQAGVSKDSEVKDRDGNTIKEDNRSYIHISKAAKPAGRSSINPENQTAAWKGCKSPCLEFFRFARVVVEEHTYVPDKLLGVIENLNAPRRWILSATPSVATFSDIRRMARLIGADLGIEDETTGSLQQDPVWHARNEKSEAERFRTYNYVYTTEWHETRHKHAQKFLDQFCRQNVPRFDNLATHYLVRPFGMTTAQKIIHKELQAILEKTNMQTVRTKSKNSVRQADHYINNSQTGSEALLKSCSYLTKQDSVQSIHGRRFQDLVQFGHVFARDLRHAILLVTQLQRSTNPKHKDDRFSEWIDSVDRGSLHNERTRSEILHSTKAAIEGYGPHSISEFYRKSMTDEAIAREKDQDKEDKKAAKKAKQAYEQPKRLPFEIPQDDFVTHKDALRLVVKDLRKNAMEYRRRTGSLLFIENLQKLLLAVSGRGPAPPCGVCNNSVADLNELLISVACGHLTCRSCLIGNEEMEICLNDPCDNRVTQARLKRVRDFIGANEEVGKTGDKIKTMTELIREFPDEDNVIIFCQFDPLMHQVAKALKTINCTHVALTDNVLKDVWTRVDLYQNTLNDIRVIILNSTNVTAAGTNLQSANRVIFMSPIDAPSQYHYTSSKTQCIGRALRMGQKKDVYVYNILALNTIDVDIFEHREQKKLIKRGSGPAAEWLAVEKHTLLPEELDGLEKTQDYSSGGHFEFPELER